MSLSSRDSWRRLSESSAGPKWLIIAAIAVPLAIGAFQFYRKVQREANEGELIVNVNSATIRELETIPGIGPGLARAIVRGRPYETVDDLERVSGIGPYTLNLMRPYVKVEGDTERR